MSSNFGSWVCLVHSLLSVLGIDICYLKQTIAHKMVGKVFHFGITPFQTQNRLVLLYGGTFNSPLLGLSFSRAISTENRCQHTYFPWFSIFKDSIWLSSKLIVQTSAPSNFCLTTDIFWSMIDRVFHSSLYIAPFFHLSGVIGLHLTKISSHRCSIWHHKALNYMSHGKHASQVFTTPLCILGNHTLRSHEWWSTAPTATQQSSAWPRGHVY